MEVSRQILSRHFQVKQKIAVEEEQCRSNETPDAEPLAKRPRYAFEGSQAESFRKAREVLLAANLKNCPNDSKDRKPLRPLSMTTRPPTAVREQSIQTTKQTLPPPSTEGMFLPLDAILPVMTTATKSIQELKKLDKEDRQRKAKIRRITGPVEPEYQSAVLWPKSPRIPCALYLPSDGFHKRARAHNINCAEITGSSDGLQQALAAYFARLHSITARAH